MAKYNHRKTEKKWQKIWEETKAFEPKDLSKSPKFYCLDMFPYPSGEGLHVGHPRGYISTDIISRYMRLQGYNVLHPMGWDAFGLPAENYAIKTGIHPEISTKKNIKRFKEQIKSIGLSYDWSREINTTDPEYYKWTQWIFLLLFKKGLAYEAVLPINFCPSCKTGLANEEVVNEKCERCGTKVVKKNLRQWVLKITAYADRLLKDLEGLDWPEKIITMQKNWIGRSEGWNIVFRLKGADKKIKVFTTRIDTLFGCTYLVIAPEHPLIEELKNKISNYKSVKKYIEEAGQKAEKERIVEVKEKTGVELEGILAINPANNRAVPIYVADYVLVSYATGVIMAVPSHDQRDFDFAKRYNLPIIDVIKPEKEKRDYEKAYEEPGILTNSKRFDGMKSDGAKEKIGKWLEFQEMAEKAINYKLRDWVFSRQRYWGEPIPIVHCEKCGLVPLEEKDLPLKLPKIKKYQPTGTGESPLAGIKEWVNVKCPKCGGPAKRETNTMPQWAGSCWYFLRYTDPKNENSVFDPKIGKYWLPVDLYVGGAEHAVLHLLYSRFWIKVLYDEKIVDFKEPFLKLRNQGLIMAPDGQKMSKSRGNVINPDDIVKKYGADVLRLYEMFMGPFEDAISWDTKGIEGCKRFLLRVWSLCQGVKENSSSFRDSDTKVSINKAIKKVGDDVKNFRFNTAISSLMILMNEIAKNQEKVTKDDIKKLLLILSPFAPHISEELWQEMGFQGGIHGQKWPAYDKKSIAEKTINLIVQVNGKIRDKIEVVSEITQEEAADVALKSEKVKKWVEKEKIKKVIFVPKRLINFVI
jgi:leucyl-tRNA synthetase